MAKSKTESAEEPTKFDKELYAEMLELKKQVEDLKRANTAMVKQSPQTGLGMAQLPPSFQNNPVANAYTSLNLPGEVEKILTDYIKAPFEKETPKEKVSKRPDGLDYVEGSYMDHLFKEHTKLYETDLLFVQPTNFGWVYCGVRLKDRKTGNSEVGVGGARIQIKRGTEIPDYKSIVDFDKNIKSALSQAIKDAQKRFGYCADIYDRRESEISELDRERYLELLKRIPFEIRDRVETKWKDMKSGYSEWLDTMEEKFPAPKEGQTPMPEAENHIVSEMEAEAEVIDTKTGEILKPETKQMIKEELEKMKANDPVMAESVEKALKEKGLIETIETELGGVEVDEKGAPLKGKKPKDEPKQKQKSWLADNNVSQPLSGEIDL